MIKMLLKLLESKIPLHTCARTRTHIFIYLKSWMEKSFPSCLALSHMSFFHFKEVMGEDGFCLPHLKRIYVLLDTQTIEKKGEYDIFYHFSNLYIKQQF